MAKDQRELSGVFFKNEYKKEAKQPDLVGQECVNGIQYDIAIWEKQGQDGRPFWSMALKVKADKEGYGHAGEKPQQARPQQQRQQPAKQQDSYYQDAPADDDIPF